MVQRSLPLAPVRKRSDVSLRGSNYLLRSLKNPTSQFPLISHPRSGGLCHVVRSELLSFVDVSYSDARTRVLTTFQIETRPTGILSNTTLFRVLSISATYGC